MRVVKLNGEAPGLILLELTQSRMGKIIRIAAKFCDNLSAYGYDDWYLPAKDETAKAIKDHFSNFTSSMSAGDVLRRYWSSTEVPPTKVMGRLTAYRATLTVMNKSNGAMGFTDENPSRFTIRQCDASFRLPDSYYCLLWSG